MNWLVTLRSSSSAKEFQQVLANIGASEISGRSAIPMENDELIVEVTGPSDLDLQLRGTTGVISVHPSSQMELY